MTVKSADHFSLQIKSVVLLEADFWGSEPRQTLISTSVSVVYMTFYFFTSNRANNFETSNVRVVQCQFPLLARLQIESNSLSRHIGAMHLHQIFIYSLQHASTHSKYKIQLMWFHLTPCKVQQQFTHSARSKRALCATFEHNHNLTVDSVPENY